MGEAGHCWLGGHFPPSRICSTNQMPSLCRLLQKLLHFLPVRRYVSSSFAEAQPSRQKKPHLHVLRLRFLLAQRLQIHLSNITVCWGSFVTSRKGMANCPQAIHYWQSVRLESLQQINVVKKYQYSFICISPWHCSPVKPHSSLVSITTPQSSGWVSGNTACKQ